MHDLPLSPGSFTGKSGELLLVVVQLVHHIHHARSNASSRYRATAAARWSQPYQSSFAILPMTILKRESVQL